MIIIKSTQVVYYDKPRHATYCNFNINDLNLMCSFIESHDSHNIIDIRFVIDINEKDYLMCFRKKFITDTVYIYIPDDSYINDNDIKECTYGIVTTILMYIYEKEPRLNDTFSKFVQQDLRFIADNAV